uniref:Cilia- and flagella-associated protein 300 n=1 Tax=Trichobilharzia regenti TaxID=157069 RepID=A0AA85JYR8_TRIRE|nr:unnamed protein product [Trichobilharzia regenti]
MEEDREEFILILEREYPSLSDKETKSFLLKWSMKGRLKAVTFTFDHMFAPYRADSFFTKFLNTSMVQQVLSIPPASINVNIKSVRCTLTNMDIFHKLSSLTYESGKIKKCMDEIFETILISDKLRECLLLEDSPDYCLFTEKERDEFLFRLFKHICVGGEVCQQEDEIKPYIDITRKIYRDLISVQKNPVSKMIEIISHVYEIQANDGQNLVFPSDKEHLNTFAYAIVDPLKRNLILFYHTFGCGEMY